jgi:hypothetical protein
MEQLTRPAEGIARFVKLVCTTLTNTGTVQGYQSQVESPSQFIIECGKIAGKAHSETTQDDMTFGIAYLRKCNNTTGCRVYYFLSQLRRKGVVFNGQIN